VSNKQINLPATSEVKVLINRIRRKYLRAEIDLNPSDDLPVSPPNDCQILRAGLIRLDSCLDGIKPKEVLAMIDCAKKSRGPKANQDDEDTKAATPSRKDAVTAATVRR
jgi:hypothetical protein